HPTKGVWDSKDRRQYRRHRINAPALMVAEGEEHDCMIEDLAIGGLKVTVDAELSIHTLVKFKDDVAGTLKGKVLRTAAGTAIIKTKTDKDAAAYILDLICREIDRAPSA
ncbi:MAG: PilZ domain-containing protein, partial [Rhodospirillales bacterium]|nr:PilZ domain-containing protein [Rhodospirillales bacterium]